VEFKKLINYEKKRILFLIVAVRWKGEVSMSIKGWVSRSADVGH